MSKKLPEGQDEGDVIMPPNKEFKMIMVPPKKYKEMQDTIKSLEEKNKQLIIILGDTKSIDDWHVCHSEKICRYPALFCSRAHTHDETNFNPEELLKQYESALERIAFGWAAQFVPYSKARMASIANKALRKKK